LIVVLCAFYKDSI